MIPLASINVGALERAAVLESFDTGWISGTGPSITQFEAELSQRIGRKYAIAVANGTVALQLALLALGIGEGDEVIVPALTFVAPAAMVRAVGATPVFADISPETWTLDPEDVARVVTAKTRAIIAVDVLGHPCDFEALSAFGLPIIEDAAQAHGAQYLDHMTGSQGIISTFSFHANKTITTGEGGCVLTDDDELATEMRLLANHGMTRDRPYWHTVVGHNFRMTSLSAAIGVGQLRRWDELVEGRRQVSKTYDRILPQELGRRPAASWATSACWLYTITSNNRSALLDYLRAEQVDARAIWPALSKLPIYADSCRSTYPVAEEIASQALWLPTWSGMPIADITEVGNIIETYLDLEGQGRLAAD